MTAGFTAEVGSPAPKPPSKGLTQWKVERHLVYGKAEPDIHHVTARYVRIESNHSVRFYNELHDIEGSLVAAYQTYYTIERTGEAA